MHVPISAVLLFGLFIKRLIPYCDTRRRVDERRKREIEERNK